MDAKTLPVPQVNYLGHWLLARGLVAEQRRRRQHARKGRAWAAPGMRVLFLSSLAHLAGELNWDDLQVAAPWALIVQECYLMQLRKLCGVMLSSA